ncbi:HSP18 transcriptional regulator [Streptomyces sp. NPDC097619]|uniref:HSP18 transcriptional regulator n=1 Tax=Streptomyces sp. NPDC097619 TaxID=3157228 RepID=UPI003325930F
MTEADPHPPPITFTAATTALEAIEQAVRHARQQHPDAAPVREEAPQPEAVGGKPDPQVVLAALQTLREVREQLAGWESVLIETARDQGASWTDLAAPLGVASRQAAERRYLRLRPGAAGSTGEQRVQATRDARAADRTVTDWARGNAADLRRLASQITALTGLHEDARDAMNDLNHALAAADAAELVRPLTDTRAHLRPQDADIADRIDALTRHTNRLRQNSNNQRKT